MRSVHYTQYSQQFHLFVSPAVQLVSAHQDVKQAVAAKDAALAAQEDQIKSLHDELHVTKEELDVTRDGLNQATIELDRVRSRDIV